MIFFAVILCLLFEGSCNNGMTPLIGTFPSDDGNDWYATGILEYTEEEDLLIVGYVDRDGTNDGFIMKADVYFRIEEISFYDAYGYHSKPFGFVVDFTNEEYYIYGSFQIGEKGSDKPYFVKLNSDFEIEWHKTFDQDYEVETSVNGLIFSENESSIYVSFNTHDGDDDSMKACIGKFSPDGEVEFLKSIETGEGDEYIRGIALYGDEGEGIVYIGESENFGDDYDDNEIYKMFWGLIDTDGNNQWSWVADDIYLSTFNLEDSQRHITRLSDYYGEPSYLISGRTSNGGIMYMKIDGTGVILWSNELFFTDSDYTLTMPDGNTLAEIEYYGDNAIYVPFNAELAYYYEYGYDYFYKEPYFQIINSDDGNDMDTVEFDAEDFLDCSESSVFGVNIGPMGGIVMAGYKKDYDYDVEDDDYTHSELMFIRTNARPEICGMDFSPYADSEFNYVFINAMPATGFFTILDDDGDQLVDLPTSNCNEDDDEEEEEDEDEDEGIGLGWTVPEYPCWNCPCYWCEYDFEMCDGCDDCEPWECYQCEYCEDAEFTCDYCEYDSEFMPEAVGEVYGGPTPFVSNYESDKDFEIQSTYLYDGVVITVGTTTDFEEPGQTKAVVMSSDTRIGNIEWTKYITADEGDVIVDSSAGSCVAYDYEDLFVLAYHSYYDDEYGMQREVPWVFRFDDNGYVDWQISIDTYADPDVVQDQVPMRAGAIQFSDYDNVLLVMTTTPSGVFYEYNYTYATNITDNSTIAVNTTYAVNVTVGNITNVTYITNTSYVQNITTEEYLDEIIPVPYYIPHAPVFTQISPWGSFQQMDKLYGREDYPHCFQGDEIPKSIEVVSGDVMLVGETTNYGPGKSIWWSLVQADQYDSWINNPHVINLTEPMDMSLVQTLKLDCTMNVEDSVLIAGDIIQQTDGYQRVFLIYTSYWGGGGPSQEEERRVRMEGGPMDIVWAKLVEFPGQSIRVQTCFEICNEEDGGEATRRGGYLESYIGCWISSEDKKFPFLIYFDTESSSVMDGWNKRLDADRLFTGDGTWEGDPRVEVNIRGVGQDYWEKEGPVSIAGFYTIEDTSYKANLDDEDCKMFPKSGVKNMFYGIAASKSSTLSFMSELVVNDYGEGRGRRRRSVVEESSRRASFDTGEMDVYDWKYVTKNTILREDIDELSTDVPEDLWNVTIDIPILDDDDGGWGDMYEPYEAGRYVDWSCEGILQSSDSVCNNGNGVCEASFYCNCDDYYEGWFCDEYDPPPPPPPDPVPSCPGNCSGSGICTFLGNSTTESVCVCTGDFGGDSCQYPVCYGVFGEEVCSGRGTCEGGECDCGDGTNYYGSECAEEIHSDGNEEKQFECNIVLRIVYIVPLDILDQYNLTGVSFDCCQYVVDCSLTPLDPDASKCYFEMNEFESELLVIILGNLGDEVNVDQIYLTPITDQDGSVEVVYEVVVDEIKTETVSAWVGPTVGTLILLLCLGLLLFCCCICVCIAGLFLCCMTICPSLFGMSGLAYKQKMEIEKFSELDDFDILLAEQKAENQDTGRDGGASLSINQKLFEIQFGEIKLLKVLGSGGSGAVVYLSIWQGKKVAFKVFKTKDLLNDSSSVSFDEFEKEVSLISSLSHPNCLSFYGCSLKPPRIGIVMEFCENGDIHGYIGLKGFSGEGIKEVLKFRMFEEIAAGMGFLHSRKIVHRDLKCENVLLDKSYVSKIMDFGLSRTFGDQNSMRMTKHVGTCYYMAPEVCLGTTYDEKVDVFSFAIMMYEIWLCTTLPYGDVVASGIEMRVALNADFRPDLEKLKDCPVWLELLMARCWAHEKDERPTFAEITEILDEEKEVMPPKKELSSEEEEEDGEEELEDKGFPFPRDEHIRLMMEKEKIIKKLRKKIKKLKSDESEEEEDPFKGFQGTSESDSSDSEEEDDPFKGFQGTDDDSDDSDEEGSSEKEEEEEDDEKAILQTLFERKVEVSSEDEKLEAVDDSSNEESEDEEAKKEVPVAPIEGEISAYELMVDDDAINKPEKYSSGKKKKKKKTKE